VHSLYNESITSLERELEAAWVADSAHEIPWISEMKQYVDKAKWLQQGLDGSIRWDRAASLATFVELCQPKDMLEIGSFLGLSSNFYLRLMEPWGGHLTSVDPNVRHRVFDAPRDIFHRVNKPFQDRLHTFDAFWMTKMSLTSGHWDYANLPPFYDNATIQAIFDERKVLTPKDFTFAGQTFDMAFIDGAHDYDSVKGDFEHVLSVMRPGSCVIFDDFDKHAWPGTYRAFMDIYKEALDSEQGLALFGDQTALFIDRGFIASRKR
jgi:predicted O-methyltransferase YrrM